MGKSQVYSKAEKLSEKTELTDSNKNVWVVGKLIGEGGFGHIYLCDEKSKKEVDCVIKVEPSDNGPMFTEVNFYRRVCQKSLILKWIKDRGLDHLGIPRFISSSCNKIVRYLVMERYGLDFHKILKRSKVAKHTIMQIALNLMEALEYIHSHKYVHADIKALNIMCDVRDSSKVYILDFGMTSIFETTAGHKPDKIDKRLKHNGTLDFCARDSHIGRQLSRRSDIESLLYNLIFWLTWDNEASSSDLGHGKLPWLDIVEKYNANSGKQNEKLLDQVHLCKEKYMDDLPSFLQEVGLDQDIAAKDLKSLLRHTNDLKYEQKPDYKLISQTMCIMIDKYRSNDPKITSANLHDLNKYLKVDWSAQCEPLSEAPSTSVVFGVKTNVKNTKANITIRDKTKRKNIDKKEKDEEVVTILDDRKYLKSSEMSRRATIKKPSVRVNQRSCRFTKCSGEMGDDDDNDEVSINRSRSVCRRNTLRQTNNNNSTNNVTDDNNNNRDKSTKNTKMLPGDVDLFLDEDNDDGNDSLLKENVQARPKNVISRQKPIISRARTQPQRISRKNTKKESHIPSTSTAKESEIIPGLKTIRNPLQSEPTRTGSARNARIKKNLETPATNEIKDDSKPKPADIIPGLKYKNQRPNPSRHQSRVLQEPNTSLARTPSTANSIIPGLKSLARAEKQKMKQRKNRASLILKNALRRSIMTQMIVDPNVDSSTE